MVLVEVNWRPDRKALRSFGLICLVACIGLGTWVFFRRSVLFFDLGPTAAHNTAYGLWAVAVLSGLLGLTFPRALLPLYIALTAVSLPIGFVVSHAVMALIFYGVFTPIAVLFRVFGRDALLRSFERDRKSYWVEREESTDHARYFRQY